MLKYPCLILDHDDTVVQSETTINYPYFCYILDQFRPGTTITQEEYTHGCFYQGFAHMCREKFNFTEEELRLEYLGWKAHIRTHVPAPYPGIEHIIHRQKEEGGLLCVVSHSSEENITRDYLTHFGTLPDAIYGWDYPEQQRKPSAFPLLDIMARFGCAPSQMLVVDDLKPAWEMCKKVDVPIAFAGWSKLEVPIISQEMERLCNFSFQSPEELYHHLFDEV